MKKKSRGPKPPNKNTIRRAAHMACAGLTYKEIAPKFGKRCHITIAKWRKRYPKIWDEAVAQWPIFNHKLGDVPLNAEKLLKAYCEEKQSISSIKKNLGITPTRTIRFLNYVGIPRRKDSSQNFQNTKNDLDIQSFATRYRKGETLQRLSAEAGKSMNTLKRHLKEAGVKIRGNTEAQLLKGKQNRHLKSKVVASSTLKKNGTPRKHNPQKIARIKVAQVLYERGHNLSEIAAALKVTRAAAYLWPKDELWEVPIREKNDTGLGFIPVTNANELMNSYLSVS